MSALDVFFKKLGLPGLLLGYLRPVVVWFYLLVLGGSSG